MSYIYKIWNDLNEKVYIGKTNLTIEERFREHKREYCKEKKEKRPLYSAMKKYGIEHFFIEKIEECFSSEAEEREKYWIKYYDSYKNGYNATLGGDGTNLYDHEEIAEALKENLFPSEVAKQFDCSSDLVRIVAREYGISIQSKGYLNVNQKRKVNQYSLKEEYIRSFDSIQLAVEWCYNHGLLKTVNSGARSHISDVANGKRKTAYGFIWKYE